MARTNIAAKYSKEAFTSKNIKLSEGTARYIELLTREKAGIISFRTSSERIFTELLTHWPILEHWEVKAQELCHRITGVLFPFACDLSAQGLEITATISAQPTEAPDHTDSSISGVVFDCCEMVERICTLSPQNPMTDVAQFVVQKGISVIARPLHAFCHVMSDNSTSKARPSSGVFDTAQRLIDDLSERANLTGHEIDILNSIKRKIGDLQKNPDGGQIPNLPNAPQTVDVQPNIAIPLVSLASFPPAIQALGNILLRYALDPSVSAELRFKFRQIIQLLIGIYPQATLAEAASREATKQAANTELSGVLRPVRPEIAAADTSVHSDLVPEENAQSHSHTQAPELTE